MSTPPIPNDINDALALYFDNQATPEVCKAIEDWLEQDPANAQIFAEFGYVERLVYTAQKTEDASAVFAMLAEMEANADAQIVTLDLNAGRRPKHDDRDALTLHDYANAGRYALRMALASRPAKKLYAYAAVAAVLLLALILINPFANEEPGILEITDNTPPKPAESAPPIPRDTPGTKTVATLTNTHNAIWAQASSAPGSLQPGSKLHPNQRLTLTAGFAEITTNDGAVAILEAPATIELLNNDNALRLHAGKLVGLCHTESSKGFVVRTDHADITDLGTEFGVHAHADGVETTVFIGEVEIRTLSEHPDQPASRVRLTEGWSSRVSRQGVLQSDPEPIDSQDHNRFAKSIEEVAAPGFAYRRAVLASKPMVYWGFDERQATTRNLAGQSKWDGQAIGQIHHDMGLFGSAIKLRGSLDAMGGFASDNPLMLKDVTAYTLEAWCWIDQPHHGCVMALSAIDDTVERKLINLGGLEVLPEQDLLGFLAGQENKLRFIHRFPVSDEFSTGQNHFSQKPVTPGQWMHLVAVKDADQAQLYINGELVLQEKDNQTVAPDKPVGLYVGVSPKMLIPDAAVAPTDFRPFAGLIDEVAVYGTALTQDTIRNHYSLGQSEINP